MARCDVYPNPGGKGYVMDVQADLLDRFATRVVVPLLPAEDVPPPLRRLNPVFRIGEGRYVLATQLVAAVPKSELRDPVASFAREREKVTAALDMLFQGF